MNFKVAGSLIAIALWVFIAFFSENRKSNSTKAEGLHSLNARPLEKNAHEALSEALAEKGDFRAAYDHQRAMVALKDSLLTEKTSEQIQRLRTQYDLEKHEQQGRIDVLQLAERDQVIRRRNWQLGAVLGGLLAAAAARAGGGRARVRR